MSRNLIRMQHKVDVYTKFTEVNDSGQKRGKWTLSHSGVKCGFTPAGSRTNIRTTPTAEAAEWHTLYFEHDSPIDFGTRLYSLTVKLSGELVLPGPLQIMQIDRHVSSITGAVQYLQIQAKTVIEQ